MKFNKKLIMQNKTVVHCKTEEEANSLLKWADSIGLKWNNSKSCLSYNNGKSYLSHNNYSNFKEETCYNFKTGSHGDLEFYEEAGYKILSFEEVKEFTKEDLKSGMLVELRNEGIYLTIGTANGLALFGKVGFIYLNKIEDDLKNTFGTEWDVIRVWIKNSIDTFSPCYLHNTEEDTTLVYEREETPEVDLDDIKLDGFTDEVIDKIADRVLYKIEESKKCNKY